MMCGRNTARPGAHTQSRNGGIILTRPVLSPQAFIYCLIFDAPGPLQAELLPLVFWFLGISDAPGTLQATPGIQAELMPLVFWSRLSYCP